LGGAIVFLLLLLLLKPMKKQIPFILEIPKPCNENWAEMTPMGLGRFCTHCQKTVTDITQMSDAQVLQLLKKNTDTHCIRAFAPQLNRPISLPPQEPTRFYRIAVALGLTLVMAAGADTYARPRPPLVEQNYLLNGEDSTKKEVTCEKDLKIRGIILDETYNIFPGAFVSLIQNGKVKSIVITEDNGSFELTLVDIKNDTELESFKIVATSMGYEDKEIFLKHELIDKGIEIKMKVHAVALGGVHFKPTNQKKQKFDKSGNKTYNAKDLKNFGL
jgi:hypothetical protein